MKICKIFLLFLACVVCVSSMQAQVLNGHPNTDVYDGWTLGVQAWSFREFTFAEAVEKVRSLGLDYIQAFPGQKLSVDNNAKFVYSMSADDKAFVKKTLAEANVRVLCYGVVGVPGKEAEARKLYAFVKDMGIKTIVSEPGPEQMDLIDKLCQEYQVQLAIHNHPKRANKPGYKHWDPEFVLSLCQGRSPWVGACPDVGHYVRTGLDPVACLKMLKGRILDVHMKEIADGHDVIWGSGAGRIKGILEHLHRQGYKGTFTVEYEYHWDNNVPEIRGSVAYFNSVSSKLKPTGWKPLFTRDLTNAVTEPDSWAWKEGVLELTPNKEGHVDIWTKDKYGDFILDLEFKLDNKTNSGIFLRAQDYNWLPWIEVQVEDSVGLGRTHEDRHFCSGIFDVYAPKVDATRPVGQWNRYTILAKGPIIQVVMNNQLVVDMNLNHWDQAGKNPDGTTNKFMVSYKSLPREGFIGFQDHGRKIWYRNLRIRKF